MRRIVIIAGEPLLRAWTGAQLQEDGFEVSGVGDTVDRVKEIRRGSPSR